MTGLRAVAAIRVRVPLLRPLAASPGIWRSADAWLIQWCDPDGRYGVGEATLHPGAGRGVQAALDALVRSIVDPKGGGGGPPVRAGADLAESTPAVAAVSAAAGAARLDMGDEPVDRPRAETVPVNALVDAGSPEAAVAGARAAVAAGFTTIKLKAGGERHTRELVQRLLAVRDAVGPAVQLRLDVNGAWDPATAEERLLALRPVGLQLVEQPVAVALDTAVTLAGLRRSTGVPVAADESVTSLSAARSLLDAGAVDALVVKPARVGGPEQALRIAELATAAGVGVVISTLLETGVGLRTALVTAALLPSGAPSLAHGLSTGSLLAADLVQGGGVQVRRGRAVCPPAPGLGLALDEAAVERYAIERVGAWR